MPAISCSAAILCAAIAAALVGQDTPPSTVPQPPSVVPQTISTVPQPRVDEWGAARHAELIARVRAAEPGGIVFIGDSITQGWEQDGSAIWKVRFAPLRAVNLGSSGDRTEHVLWRLREAPISRLEPSMVVIMIGTNNVGHGRDDAAATLAGVKSVVELVRAQVPEASIVLCAILPRGPSMNSMRGDILQVNQALARTYPGDGPSRGVQVLDLGTRFIDPDGGILAALMPDGLHLSAAGYSEWADGLRPLVPVAPDAAPREVPTASPEAAAAAH